MMIKCTIRIVKSFGELFLLTTTPYKNKILSYMLVNRVGMKSETDMMVLSFVKSSMYR